ncbi:hypothetical protein C0993_009044 [Termitomyces sp. T159_Od127]|nr:hypothetical protein C0993_009044 [Termitomyces sp. T159_Od127]
MSTPSKPASSEDIVGQKAYVSPLISTLHLTLHSGEGFSAGVVASVIFFCRRTWPIALSTGFGASAAYADCDHSFNPARIPGTRIVSPSELAPSK